MILTNNQIVSLIKDPAHSLEIKKGIRIQNDHKVHVTGKGWLEYLTKIEGVEDAEEFGRRKELSKPVTLRITKRIIDELSRWTNAQGTNKVYDISNDTKQIEFRKDVLSQVWKEESMEYFILNFLKDAMYSDFGGFIMVEQERVIREEGLPTMAEKEGRIRAIGENEQPLPYLVFRSLNHVHDYDSKGNRVEYLITHFGTRTREDNKEVELFRVQDDAFDYVYEKIGDSIVESTVIPAIPNELGYVPAIQISTKLHNVLIDEIKTSYMNQVIPQLNLYLTDYSEHAISAILHSHPIYYQMGMRCRYKNLQTGAECDGGQIAIDDGQVDCPNCAGIGSIVAKGSSDAIIMPQVDEAGNAFNINDVAGYVTPDIESLTNQRTELDWIEDQIVASATGQIQNASTNGTRENTATEVIMNTKPLEDIISFIVSNVEFVEEFCTNTIGLLFYGPEVYKGSSINYGRKLNLRDENMILKEIEQAKKSGSSNSLIKTLIEELIHSRYKRSPIELERQQVMLEMEPAVGYTTDEITDNPNFSVDVKKMKFNFMDYINRFEREVSLLQDFMPGVEFMTKVDAILKQLEIYNSETLLAEKVTDVDPQPPANEDES